MCRHSSCKYCSDRKNIYTQLGGGLTVRRILVSVVLIGLSTVAMASASTAVPEIDASSGAVAVSLMLGGLLVLGARRKR